MNGNDLLKALSRIDDGLIAQAEKGKVSKTKTRLAVSAAASFLVIFAALFLWLGNQSAYNSATPSIGNSATVSGKVYTLYFNNCDSQAARDIYIEGHFWQELTEEQAIKLLPGISKNYQVSGTVHYSHADGATSIFSVNTSFKSSGGDVEVTISPGEVVKCYVIEGDPVISEIEGVKIDAGIFASGEKAYIYYADFSIEGVAYYVEYTGSEYDGDFFTGIIADIVLGGNADLTPLCSPAVPELRDDALTESESYNEPDFGAYLPKVPVSYQFNNGRRFINQEDDYLLASWSHGYNDVWVKISKLKEQDLQRLVAPEDTQLYDMSLYPIPWADSMPSDTREIIENPIFKIEDLTADMLKMREYISGERSKDCVSMSFSVLYNDIIVEIYAKGLSSEYLFNELSRIALN